MRRRTAATAATAFLLATGCQSVERDPLPTASSAIIAVFAPDSAEPCNSDLPFPTDLAIDPATGLVGVPFCMGDSPETVALKKGFGTLDGFALGSPITVRFTGALDPATIDGSITIIDIMGMPVQFQTAFFAEQNNLLVIQPTTPLAEKNTYLVVIDNTIKGADGRKVVMDQALALASSKTPLIDDKGYSAVAAIDDITANGLEFLRQALVEAWAAAEFATEKDRDQLVSVNGFTTQTVYSAIPGLNALAASKGGARVSHETSIRAADHALVAAAGIPVSNVCAIHTGSIQLTSFLTAGGTFGRNATGLPVTSTASVDYVLTTPKNGGACATVEPWDMRNVAVFSHALGRCKNDALAMANGLAGAGYAVLAIDGPRAGVRAANALGDQNLDGCPDSPDTPEIIAAAGESTNPFAIRDRLREWGLELGQVANRVTTTPWVFAGQAAPGGTPTPPRVVMTGHSWGGIATLLAAPNVDGLDAVAVNATAGNLGAAFAPLVQAGVAASMPGASAAEIAAASQDAIGQFAWVFEGADALHSTGAYAPTLPVLLQVVSAGSDTADLHGKALQKQLADAFGGAGKTASTFVLAADENSPTFCSDPTASLGALLQPCADESAPPAAQMAAGAAYLGMQRQLVTFLATATSTGAVVCDPNITVACP